MKEFILLVRLPLSYTTQLKEINDKWTALREKWEADSIFVTSFVFPDEGYVISGADNARKEYSLSDNTRVVSNIVLLAPGLDAAVELAKECPVFGVGGTVEVREVRPRPVPQK